MSDVHLDTLAAWPTDSDSQPAHDRYRLLAAVARKLDIVGRRPSRRQWQLATVPADALDQLRDAVETEGTRTHRRRVTVGAGYRFQSVAYYPARARQQLLDRIDAHLPPEVD